MTPQQPPRKTLAGLRRSALLEIIVMLGVMLLINLLPFSSGTRFWNTNPHPFWLVVLLISCKYGTREGLLAAVASSVALLAWNIPEHAIDQDMYGYLLTIVKMPLMWLVGATIFGELRSMHMRERDDLISNLNSSVERETTIARSYQWVKDLKERLELRMAGQLRSSIASYHAGKAMERLSADEVLQGLEELISNAFNPEQFSIYTFGPKGMDLLLAHGWKEKDPYPRQYDTRHRLTQYIGGNSGVLCVVNQDHEQLLAGQGILAGTITDRESGEVIGMLKIEKLGFTELNLSTIESFSAICEWAGIALMNARKYQTAKSQSMVNPDHNMLTYNYFRRYLDFIAPLAKRVGFDVNMIVIHLANPTQLNEDSKIRVGRLLSDAVDRALRDVDLAFDYQAHSDEYSVVLPATNHRGAEIVLERIRQDILERTRKTVPEASFSFSIQTIYAKA